MTTEWRSNDHPPPMEWWPADEHRNTLRYIRPVEGGYAAIEYGDGDQHGDAPFKTLAGPFEDLDAAKVAWLLMFPLETYETV